MRRERKRRRRIVELVVVAVVGGGKVLVEVGDEKEMTRQIMAIMMIDHTHHRAIEAVAVKRIRRRSEVAEVKGTRIEESVRAEEEEDIAGLRADQVIA